MDERDKIVMDMYRNDLPSFLEFAFRTLHPNREYLHHWIIEVLGGYLQRCYQGECKRLIINMPPRYLKSMCTSIAFPAWVLAHRPEATFMCITGNRGLVEDHEIWTRDLMTHPRYRALFPHVRLSESDHGIRLIQGGSRNGFMPTRSITGRGADFIIIDDPSPAGLADDRIHFEYVNNWFDQNIYQRLDDKDKGVIIVVMQRLHINDLTGHLLKKEGWELLNLPAIAEEDERHPLPFGNWITRSKDEALHPGIEDWSRLREVMKHISAKAFMAQYQQKPYPPGEGGAHGGWFTYAPPGKEYDSGFMPFLGRVQEEDLVLGTLFGEEGHPRPYVWPEYTIDEWEERHGPKARASYARRL